MSRKGHGRKPAGVELSDIHASITIWLSTYMKDQRGFLQIPLLIAILIGTIVIGGSTYVVTKGISKTPLVAIGEKKPATTSAIVATNSADTETVSPAETRQIKQTTTHPSTQPIQQQQSSGSGASASASSEAASTVTAIPTAEVASVKPQAPSDTERTILTATCAPDADVIKAGIPVTYTATITGGIEPYTFSWSEPSNTHVYPTALDMQSLRVRYKGNPETRTETESLTVVSADEQSATASCGVTVSAVPVEKSAYSDSACLAQKQSYLPEVDAAYLSWFDQWQAARTQLDPCYTSNPIPYCDKQMGDLNVEWQEKISATMKSYQNKLTQCAPDQRKFGDVSDMVPSSY